MSEKAVSCVLFADRHHGLTEGVRDLLATVSTTVVMVGDETSLLDSARKLQPQVVVVDLSLVRGGSLRWLSELRAHSPQTLVIIVSVHDEQSVQRAVMGAGADGFVLKRAIATDLLPAIEAAVTHRAAAHP